MGWSSWYGFTSNINETMVYEMAQGMVSTGLHAAGYEHIWLDDGWAVARVNTTGCCLDYGPAPGCKDSCKVIEEASLFPSGMGALVKKVHDLDLKFGIYTSKGPKTCLGYQPTQPHRPGACGYEQIDADTYVHDWDVDQVKDDGCGACPQHDPWQAMATALNNTGKPIWYAIHAGTQPNASYAKYSNMWRVGGDLSSATFDMWTNRLDLATAPGQAALTGPGAFPNPDFLEVGYTPRNPKGRAGLSTLIERRSMFTMWAALPGPLILSAELRPNKPWGGVDPDILAILTNKEVIAINQDTLAAPMRPISRLDGAEVWKKPLASGAAAIILFYRNTTGQQYGQAGAGSTKPEAGEEYHAVDEPGSKYYKPSPSTSSLPLLVSVGTPVPAGTMLSKVMCNAGGLSFDVPVETGAVVYRDDKTLCLGAVGTCKCSNPPSPKLGLAKCNAADPTQLFTFRNGVLSAGPKKDVNSGPTCPGDRGNSLLIYPEQDHANEQWSYNTQTGEIKQSATGFGPYCMGTAAAVPPPAPPTRVIGVTWEELGFPPSKSVAVRDVWAGKDLGSFTGQFNATVQYHETATFIFH